MSGEGGASQAAAGSSPPADWALARLRVAAEWHAPIERNQYEARWMQVAQVTR